MDIQKFRETFRYINPCYNDIYDASNPSKKEALHAIVEAFIEHIDTIFNLQDEEKDLFEIILYELVESPYLFYDLKEKCSSLNEFANEVGQIRDEILTTVKKEIKPMYSETPLRVQVDAIHNLKELRKDLKELLPPSRELSLALTKIEEAELWIGKVQVGGESNES